MGAFDHLKVGQVSHGCKCDISLSLFSLLLPIIRLRALADISDWGNHTASIDWCEQNYVHTPYIAEFYNTLTNLPTILLGLWGCYGSFKGGLRRRYALGYLGLTGIGLGSLLFHATLKYEAQLLDELPMVRRIFLRRAVEFAKRRKFALLTAQIYLVSYCGYLVLDTLPGFVPRFGWFGPAVLIGWSIFVTVS